MSFSVVSCSVSVTTTPMRLLHLHTRRSISIALLTVALLQGLAVRAQHSDYQSHYLVGLLNLPNSNIPDIFRGITSGSYLGQGEYDNWIAHPDVPFSDVPWVGFSDIEPYYYKEGEEGPQGATGAALGQFFVLSDNGYGGSANSADYPLNIARVKLERPFAFGHAGSESAFGRYTEAEVLDTVYIHDPHGFIKWENGADIQVTYKVPDDTWADLINDRVLTGRDFDPEGLAVLNSSCAVLGDELMPSVINVDPSTGEVLSPFVRTPEIDSQGNFVPDKFLSTVSDKMHCNVKDLEEDADLCMQVTSDVVEKSGYREHHKSGGFEGFAALPDGSVAAFLEKPLAGEPGIRVYNVDPGSCALGEPPVFKSFRGFYEFEKNAVSIADVSAIPGTSRYVLVQERNNYPGLLSDFPSFGEGHQFPSPALPANKVCLVDLTDLDDDLVMRNKKCVLNLHAISDPWDVDGNGIDRFGITQVTTEQVAVVDDYCIVVGTDTNYPWINQLGLNLTSLPYGTEVADSRWMVVCFDEPIFDVDILQDYMSGNSPAGSVPKTEEGEESSASKLAFSALFHPIAVQVLGLASFYLFYM